MLEPYPGKQVRDVGLLLLTGLALYLCWLLARPFLSAIAWALALAVVAHPLHRRFELCLRPSLAALFSVLAVSVVLLTTGALLLQKFYDEVVGGLRRAAGLLVGHAPAVLSGSVQVVTQAAIMLVTLFYFLRNRRSLLGFLFRLLPLSSEEGHELAHRVSETISATLYGNLVVKLVQGILGGLMFWILGLPAPLLFGILMALLAMLPVVGTSLVLGTSRYRSSISRKLGQGNCVGYLGRSCREPH
jgi:predicted PurR-regulated permease PerM